MYISSTSADYFGTRLREIRTKSGLSQQTLSSELGISKAALCYYESGKRIPDITFLERVAIYFGVSLDYLMGFSDAMDPKKAKLVDWAGLSEESVELLADSHDSEFVSQILDLLIKNSKFRDCLQLVEIASHNTQVPNGNMSSTDFLTHISASELGISFTSYVIERLLLEAIEETISDRKSTIGAQLLNKVVPDKDKDSFYKWLLSPERDQNYADRIAELDRDREKHYQQILASWKEDTKIRDEAIRNLKNSNDIK